MKRTLLSLLVLLCLAELGKANIVIDTLWINRDTIQVSGDVFHLCTFNDSATFYRENMTFELNPDDTLEVAVINTDSVAHTFTIDGYLTTGNIILPTDTETFTIDLTGTEGTYRFYSEAVQGGLLGGSGIIFIGYEQYPRFYWNLFDQQDIVSADIANNVSTAVPANYMPDFFSINGHNYPETTQDSTGLVVGAVYDTLIISITNSGAMVHSLHFHGYHVEILQMNKRPSYIGWIKDSFPVALGEEMTVMLVPHQPGLYPIHDHNLISVTTAGGYPGGMITVLTIVP